ncbi:MAG: exodeoxyribonuclease V subunit gamma, partial [Clostridia bacterium]|nr:exodeoxyribonuclease V subunit gamma [Clostridia bacterium]
MIKFVCGPSGSGKSTYIYNRIIDELKNNKRPILIVPDQQVLFAERIIADMTEGSTTFSLEILSFSRLANHVFRALGGLSFCNIDDGGRLLIMWRAINEISPFLEIYKNNDETNSSFVELMMSTVDELKQFSISPAMLEIASGKLKEKHPELSKKLSDISLIYGTYQSFVTKEYNDPADELTRLSQKLENSDFFAQNNVYFDSFDGFTPQQYSIISHIVTQAQNVTFSLCYDINDKTGIFKTTEKTYKNLERIVERLSKESELIRLEEEYFGSEDIRYVSKNLWNHSASPSGFVGNSTNVNTVCCHDIFEECEAVVSDIIKTVRSGERYKNILVIARDITEYEGIIDTELENNGVPFYMSKRTDITTKPIFKLILAALAIKNRNWRFSDVISYVKTGLAGLSYEECNILENYASAWNINGSRW